MRLDRILANSGYGSRSTVRSLIRSGRISVAGQTVRDPGLAVQDEAMDRIVLDGQPITVRRYIHLMLYKPAGLVTALTDPRLPTIADLIPDAFNNSGLVPVGRLDRDATGLLLLTNDGTLNHRLASPRWGIWKSYRLTYLGDTFHEDLCCLFAAGLLLPNGERCLPAILGLRGNHEADLQIHEGKFHQVKRMVAAVGREVQTLHRYALGPLVLDPQLCAGQSRLLTDKEAAALYRSVQLQSP